MKTIAGFANLLCAAFIFCAPLFAAGEKTLSLGGNDGWNLLERMEGAELQDGLRPKTALTLASHREIAAAQGGALQNSAAEMPPLDMALSFDEANPARYRDEARNYTIAVSGDVHTAPVRWAYQGSGAAVFDITRKTFVTAKSAKTEALFSDGSRYGSFSIEFFLFPRTADGAQEFFAWNASHPVNRAQDGASTSVQIVKAVLERGKSAVIFENFFTSPDDAKTVNLRLASKQSINLEKYSHHLIRFDHSAGLIEYLVNGVLEDVRYATETGRFGAEIYTPFAGRGGSFVIGRGVNGIIDEFRVYSGFLQNAETARYASAGWAETRAIDLGSSRILSLSAEGGSAGGGKNSFDGILDNKKSGENSVILDDGSEIQLFLKFHDAPYSWEDIPWQAVKPGAAISASARYVQIAAALYPSSDNLRAPYISNISLNYKPAELPAPPSVVTAKSGDGFVELKWKKSGSPSAAGYKVYIGKKSGEYWNIDPVDAGSVDTIRVENLENGAAYWFAVSSYNAEGDMSVFSQEVHARPLPERRR